MRCSKPSPGPGRRLEGLHPSRPQQVPPCLTETQTHTRTHAHVLHQPPNCARRGASRCQALAPAAAAQPIIRCPRRMWSVCDKCPRDKCWCARVAAVADTLCRAAPADDDMDPAFLQSVLEGLDPCAPPRPTHPPALCLCAVCVCVCALCVFCAFAVCRVCVWTRARPAVCVCRVCVVCVSCMCVCCVPCVCLLWLSAPCVCRVCAVCRISLCMWCVVCVVCVACFPPPAPSACSRLSLPTPDTAYESWAVCGSSGARSTRRRCSGNQRRTRNSLPL